MYNLEPVSSEEGKALATQLEMLGAVALATVTAVVKVVEKRRSGLLTPEEEEKIGDLRAHIESALAAVDEYTARTGQEAIDLGGLRERLVSILRTLPAQTADHDTPPS